MIVPKYEQFIRAHFGKNASRFLAKYPAYTKKVTQHQMERITTDIDFALAAKFVAGFIADLNQSTYLYKFIYVLPGQPNGAYHTSELYFVFTRTGNPNGEIKVT
jgi:para-nitrobenzyl esterase